MSLEYRYLAISDPMIEEVITLFEEGKARGGTSSSSLELAKNGKQISVVLVCIEHELIGALELSPIDDKEVRIRNLVVKDKYRRHGIGSELVVRAENKIKSDYSPVFIKTIPMPDSYSLFAKLGYTWDCSSEYDWFKRIDT